MNNQPSQQSPKHPQANIVKISRDLWKWLIPAGTILFMIIILAQNAGTSGPQMTIYFSQGHGIKVGDTLRHRGIAVGEIQEVHIDASAQKVRVRINLMPQAEFLARSRSRFWIVRPRLSLTNISGADTIIGARYIAVSPGDGDATLTFAGLDTEPAIIHRDPLGLEIICQAPQRYGLQSGAPVMYRQIVIGRVLSVNLASDASAIETRIYIDAQYRALIRDNTVFWNASGLNLSAGILAGLKINIESLEALVHGGIAIAVPNNQGKTASNGQRFPLHATAEKDWQTWSPSIDLSDTKNIHESDIANIVQAQLSWLETGMFSNTQRSSTAQIIAVNGGVIGPSSILNNLSAKPYIPQLIIDTHAQPLPEPLWEQSGLVYTALSLPRIPWTTAQMRIPQQIEDADAVLSPDQHFHIAVTRLSTNNNDNNEKNQRWILTTNTPTDNTWHGSPVLARSDRKLIGFLLVEKKKTYIVPMNAELLKLIE